MKPKPLQPPPFKGSFWGWVVIITTGHGLIWLSLRKGAWIWKTDPKAAFVFQKKAEAEAMAFERVSAKPTLIGSVKVVERAVKRG